MKLITSIGLIMDGGLDLRHKNELVHPQALSIAPRTTQPFHLAPHNYILTPCPIQRKINV